MRRVALYLLVAALTFCAGSLAHKFWPAAPPTAYHLPLPVSLCQLTAASELYDGAEVQVRAVLYANGGEPFVSDDSCASSATRIPVKVDTKALAGWGLPGWGSSLAYCGKDPNPAAAASWWSAEVIITGTFKVGHPPLNGGFAKDQPSLISRSFLQLSRASERR